MRVDLVDSSLKALIRTSEPMLISGLVIDEKIDQWALEQVSSSIFTPPRAFPFVGIHVALAKSFVDASKYRNLVAPSTVAAKIASKPLYDVTIRVIAEGDSVSGEEPGSDTDMYETVDAMFKLLVARFILMIRDNAEFSSTPAGFTLALETERGGSETQIVTLQDFSGLAPWGAGGDSVAFHTNDIKFRLSTCGEPRADS